MPSEQGGYDDGVRPHLASLVGEFRQHSAETAVVAHRGNRRYRTTYGELARIAGRFAAELEERGIVAGDRVILWGENSAEWIGAFFGCILRGVIAVPLDAAGTSEFADRVIRDVSPKLITGDRGLLQSLKADVRQLPFADFDAELPAQPSFTISEKVNSQTPFQIVFTSGTTAEPRGVVHTHRNVLASLQPIEDEIAKYRKYEHVVHPLRFLQTLPLSHVFGQFMGLWIPPLLAAEVHFSDHVDPARMISAIRSERISVLVAVPRILQLLRAHLLGHAESLIEQLVDAKDLSIWRRWWRFRRVHRLFGWKFWAVVSGGATLPPEVESFWSTLGFAPIQGYGMTETAALVTLNHPFHIGQGTIGKALPGREVRISDEGEILVRGDMLAQAMWRNGAMRPREEEWLATGDLAAQEKSGELRFLGRRSDVIVTGAGMNIHPFDLEEAMMKQPGVRGCVVVSFEAPGGAEPVAVVLFTGSDEQMRAAVAQANSALSGFQQIRRTLRWSELQFPYTSTGKLLRRQVADWACAVLSNQQPHPTAASSDALVHAIVEVTGEPAADNDSSQRLSEDLHLDSLGRVQLQSLLEQRLGTELDDDAMATAQTLGDLRRLVESEHTALPTAPANVTSPHQSKAAAREPTVVEYSYPRWPWSVPIRVARVLFIEIIMRPLIWLLVAPETRREGALPRGPMLLIANHVTAYDGALVLYALPASVRRRTAIAMAGEMLDDLRRGKNQGNALLDLLAPAAYWLVTALFNVFPLPRMAGFRRSFAHAGEAMDSGYSVLIFPEGTRSPDGRLQRFRPGTGLLAQESRVPVVPVELTGLGEMRARRRWFRSGNLTIHVGAAIKVGEGATPSELTTKFEQCFERLR